MPPLYDYSCNSCLHKFSESVKYEDRDKLGNIVCPVCSHLQVSRYFPAPTISKVSFPDGYKRPGWVDLKEAAKLEVAKANINSLKPGERSKISKEINRLRSEGSSKSAAHDRRDSPGSEHAVEKSTAEVPSSMKSNEGD